MTTETETTRTSVPGYLEVEQNHCYSTLRAQIDPRKLREADVTAIEALYRVIDMHPIYYVSEVVCHGPSTILMRVKPRRENGQLVINIQIPLSLKKSDDRALDVLYRGSDGRPTDWQKLPYPSLDSLPSVAMALTDGALAENPGDIELMAGYNPKPSMFAGDARILAAHRSVTEALKGRFEAHRSDLAKPVIYIWSDTRIDTRRHRGVWRYAMIMGEKRFFSRENAYSTAERAAGYAAQRASEASGEKDYVQDKDGYPVASNAVKIVFSLPPEDMAEEAEKIFEERFKREPSIDEILVNVERIIAGAKRMGEDMTRFGGFADAQALDNYILQAEMGALALNRIGGGRAAPPGLHKMVRGPLGGFGGPFVRFREWDDQ